MVIYYIKRFLVGPFCVVVCFQNSKIMNPFFLGANINEVITGITTNFGWDCIAQISVDGVNISISIKNLKTKMH